MPGHGRIDVFDYLDYRAFLHDYYTRMKSAGRGFSYRTFSRRAGLGSPNHLKRVMDGERNLTAEMAARFAQALSLEGEAADYFQELVRFCQAKTSVDRSRAYARMVTFSTYRKTRKLDLAHAEYHATWYIPAVRELAGRRTSAPIHNGSRRGCGHGSSRLKPNSRSRRS